jgi:hypothetical protein
MKTEVIPSPQRASMFPLRFLGSLLQGRLTQAYPGAVRA